MFSFVLQNLVSLDYDCGFVYHFSSYLHWRICSMLFKHNAQVKKYSKQFRIINSTYAFYHEIIPDYSFIWTFYKYFLTRILFYFQLLNCFWKFWLRKNSLESRFGRWLFFLPRNCSLRPIAKSYEYLAIYKEFFFSTYGNCVKRCHSNLWNIL